MNSRPNAPAAPWRPSSREERETRFGQRAHVVWLFGLSGAGKSTLAAGLESVWTQQGRVTVALDGDMLRDGLNRGLGFSDEDRQENLRRAAELAALLLRSGIIVIAAFITPLRVHRAMIRQIVGESDLTFIHVSTPMDVCAQRDPKGLYARAAADDLKQFTGRDSAFEAPQPDEPMFTLDTSRETPAESLARLSELVRPRLAVRHA